MISLLSTAWKAVTGFAGGLGLWGYVAAAAVAASLSGYIIHTMDNSTLNALKLSDSMAEVAAVQLSEKRMQISDKVSLDAAVAEAQAQQKIVTQTQIVKERIPVYVTDTSRCITYGLVWVLNGAAHSTDPSALPIPAGQSIDSCAPVTWRSFAADISDDYASAQANSEQLTALQDWTRKQATVPSP